MKYRKKPVVIDAYCYDLKRDNYRPDWFMNKLSTNEIVTYKDYAIITNDHGDAFIELGDWVILDADGNLYPCSDELFKMTYEAVEDSEWQ